MNEPLCTYCGHEQMDSSFHFDAPGENWGAALHWFHPPKITNQLIFNMADSVPEDQIEVPFIQGMINRMCFGFYNYGHARRKHDRPDNIKNMLIRLIKYVGFTRVQQALAELKSNFGSEYGSGNIEFLMDEANYAMMEFMVPSHPEAHLRPTESHESPGSHVAGRIVKSKHELKPQHNVRQPKEGD